MKRLALSLFALLPISTAWATPPEPATDAAREAAEVVVQKKLLQPLAMKEREHSKFSRARLPPQERRLRLQQAATDAAGATFYVFAVDDRHGFAEESDAWNTDVIVGCVYPERTEVFVKRGDEHRPAALLLGKKAKAAPAGTCAAAPTPAATTTTAAAAAASVSQG
jgi:hypothetical protein